MNSLEISIKSIFLHSFHVVDTHHVSMKWMSTPQSRDVSLNLDLLRAVAVMSVFFAHLRRAQNDPSFSSLGNFGVILFFVHTSFVLMASLQRLDRTAKGNIVLALAFWIRRIFRIYPLAILCVALVAFFHIPANPGEIYAWIGWKGFFSNLALIQNLDNCKDIQGVLWSLPIELQMYIILPFAYLAIRGGRHYRSLPLWVLSLLPVLMVPVISARVGVFVYAPCFTAGIVAFDLTRSRTWTGKLPAWVWPVGIFVAIAWYGPAGLTIKLYRAWGVCLLLGVLYANVEESQLNRIYKVFHWIAEHSYGIYLSHSVVLWIVFDSMAQFPPWVKIPALIAGAIGFPALLYVALERPLVRVGGRIAGRLLMPSAVCKESRHA
jgi:peptidoglycan/LPS O-acetylase OafA/YrhL